MERVVISLFCLIYSCFVIAGNTEIMEQEAKSLIELNEKVIQQLPESQNSNGRIVFSGNVVKQGENVDIQTTESQFYPTNQNKELSTNKGTSDLDVSYEQMIFEQKYQVTPPEDNTNSSNISSPSFLGGGNFQSR